ncbi:Oidioi.mRNA.OKI2018_I69.XSR.g13325.t1.cds [Oikopleura dioica]|uniref:Oidioi.mRNA.OKI2018_I69.XSR.g13325.t1.cds n=1 Tax=Oikopleura dioica TaxID=34765 RepID=A0ABN7SAE8_OIKDI|nr:Oidioi.mRNA.OKI2018_I69.XSR.g13325.t1.cds [Oikopleura dioica]
MALNKMELANGRMPDLIDTSGSVITKHSLAEAVEERKLRSKQKFNFSKIEDFRLRRNSKALQKRVRIPAKACQGKEDSSAASEGNTESQQKPSKSAKPQQLRGVTGLKNLGNTCYLNTIVQVLASLKCFREALQEVEFAVQSPTRNSSDDGSRHSSGLKNWGLITVIRHYKSNSSKAIDQTKSLQQLVGELNAGRRLTVEPSSFVQAVHDQLPNFNGHIQQDVQEFFCQLLYKLEKERTKGCSEDILNCVVNRMFTGQWQSEVICTQCGNKTTKSKSSTRCLWNSQISITRILDPAPSHSSGQEKIACHVDFPEKLNLTPYMTHKATSPEYVLRAVVVHHGKYFNSGHYTTFCYKDSEKKDGKASGWVQESFQNNLKLFIFHENSGSCVAT